MSKPATYIVLEFWDTRRRQPFLVGSVIDSYASGEHDTPRFFKIEGHRLSDDLFLDGDRPRSAREFRQVLARIGGATLYATAEQYRQDLLAKFGHLSDRFFTLLVKALAFQPITDIRRFVYDYVLEARSINIEAMRENLQQYRQFELLAAQTREKISALEEIRSTFAEKLRVEEAILTQDYLILRARREAAAERWEALEQERAQLEQEVAAARAAREDIAKELGRARERQVELEAALRQNSTYLLVDRLEREIRALREREARLREEARALRERAAAEAAKLAEALALARENGSALGADPADPDVAASLAVLAGAADVWAPARQEQWSAPVPSADLETLAAAAGVLADRAADRLHAIRAQSAALVDEQKRLEEDLRRLESRRLAYEPYVDDLRRLIAEETGVEARVLCELLEIPNEKWQNAVEGYLNTQRFDLIVPPEAFDTALAVYERRKHQFRLHSVGLVNTGRILAHGGDDIRGSLAEEVVTDDPYARAYINRLLGRVMKCESEQELKHHNLAITPTCMTYRNHTARQIPFHVYDVWYIGARALVRQRERKQARLAEVREGLAGLARVASLCERFRELLKDKSVLYGDVVRPAWERVSALPALADEVAAKAAELERLDRSELEGLQRELLATRALVESLERQSDELWGREHRARARSEQVEIQLRAAEEERQVLTRELEAFAAAYPDVAGHGAVRYQEERRHRSNEAIVAGFTANRETLRTRAQNLRDQLTRLRFEYNTRYQFGGAPQADDNIAYEAEWRKLTESELPTYSERIAAAKAAAEQEFKEHFVYKLREQIEAAHEEFRRLNSVLREIPFGQDRYQFSVTANPSYKHFYDMLMDPMLLEGYNLFNRDFQERYGAVVSELFSLILEGTEEEQLRNIELFTDYRTYLDFDIRIDHGNGEHSLFSKVCREKSGGETQTPYYVAMVASFLQVYRPRNEDSIRLMMFDEAFNRMDPDRVENTLLFIRQVGLQVLAAAPTDKCEIIAPYMDTTLLVMRSGHRTWVEDYHQVIGEIAAPARAEAAATAEAAGPVDGAPDGATAGDGVMLWSPNAAPRSGPGETVR